MNIFILSATITETNHQFIELFTTDELLKKFIKAHPEITVREITLHETNPF